MSSKHFNPQDDPEAILLSALMRARDQERAHAVVHTLSSEDFYDDSFATIYATIKERMALGRPVNPASIRSALHAQGDQPGMEVGSIDALISMLTGLEHIPEHLADYARQVASSSYRRQFRNMAQALNESGKTAPEARLYDVFVEEGKAQRKKWDLYREHHR